MRKKKPVGTKTTEAIIGASATKLSMAVKAIVESQTVLNQFAEKVDNLTLTHTDLEAKIQALEQEKQNQIKQVAIEVKQAFESERAKFAKEYADGIGAVIIDSKEYNAAKAKLTKLETEYASDLDKARAAASEAAQKEYDNKFALAQAEQKAKEAQTSAELKSLKETLEGYKSEIASWKEALAEERKAGVERAKAGSIGNLNVGGATGRA